MSAANSVFFLMFGSGLLGGFGHCSGMCGPLVAGYSMRLCSGEKSSASVRALPHLLYNAGRITTYSIIGGLMGLTGSFSSVVQSIGRFQSLTMAAVGLAMILMGLSAAGLFGSNNASAPSAAARRPLTLVADAVRGLIAFIASARTAGAFYSIGLATGFIPCGLLYTAYIAAAGAGAEAGGRTEGLIRGMLMLLFFGLGTVPPLFLIGRIAALRSDWIRRRLYRLAALFMILAGGLLMYRALVF